MNSQFQEAPVTLINHVLTFRMDRVLSSLENLSDDMFRGKRYNLDDFNHQIAHIRECPPDEIPTAKMQLYDMFRKCGTEDIEYGKDLSYYENLLQICDIPTREQMTTWAYEFLMNEFRKNPYPTPEKYIARVVNHKVSPEWAKDSLRLKILKQFVLCADGLKAAGYSIACIKKYIKDKLNREKVSPAEIISNLDEKIFSLLNEGRERERKAREALSEFKEAQKQNGIPAKEYSADPEYLRLKKSLESETNNRKQNYSNKGKYTLLKMADDLACGKFGNAGVVREEIYLFAVVFGLTYSADNDKADDLNDIENVMFRDYYANNIMRYISGNNPHLRTGGEEVNPTGKGINYKNYVEVIFLYYLFKDRAGTSDPSEKLIQIYRMANEVHEMYTAGGRAKELSAKTKEIMTRLFIDEVKPEDSYDSDGYESILHSDEESFKQYLADCYDCSFPPDKTSAFGKEAEQNTATGIYLDLLEEAYGDNAGKDKYDGMGLSCFCDEYSLIKNTVVDIEKGRLSVESLSDRDKFNVLLYEVDRDLQKIKTKEEAVQSRVISRTDILKLVYQLFIINRMERRNAALYRSFSYTYHDFCEYSSAYLEAALFHPIDGRNLYDLILIYSAYCSGNDF